MAKKTFTAALGARDNDALIEIPFDARDVFGSKRAPVVATVAGVTWRTTVSVYGGRYFVGMRKDLRSQAGVDPGDEVSVTLESDDAPRTVDGPPDLARALSRSREAKKAFDALSFTHRKEYVRWVDEAKKDDTRQRRVHKTIEMLLAGTKHP